MRAAEATCARRRTRPGRVDSARSLLHAGHRRSRRRQSDSRSICTRGGRTSEIEVQEDRSEDLPPNSAAPPPLGARGVRPRGEFIQGYCLQGGTGTAVQSGLGGACF